MTYLVLDEVRTVSKPDGSRWPIVIIDHGYRQTLHADSWECAARALIPEEYGYPEHAPFTAHWIDCAATARRRFAIDAATVLQGIAMTEGDMTQLSDLEVEAVGEDRSYPILATGAWGAAVPLIVVASSYLGVTSPSLPTGDAWVLDDVCDESLIRSYCWIQDIDLRLDES